MYKDVEATQLEPNCLKRMIKKEKSVNFSNLLIYPRFFLPKCIKCIKNLIKTITVKPALDFPHHSLGKSKMYKMYNCYKTAVLKIAISWC